MIQSTWLVIESDGFDITTHQFDTKKKALVFMDVAQRSDEDVLIREGLTERNTIRKLQEVQVEVDLSKANEEFVTNFMKNELRENFDVEKMDETEIDAIAAKAFEIYQRGDGQTEYEALEEAYDAHVYEDTVKGYERQTEDKAQEYETLDLTKTLRDETSDYEKMDPKDDPLDCMDIER